MRSRTAQIALIGTTAVVVAVFLATIPTFRHFFDLGVYRGAVHYWLLDGGDLYEYRYQGTEYGFTYPPFAALAMSPLAITSWPVAVAAALTVNAAAVILLIRWYFVPILQARDWPIWTPCALLFLGFLVFEPSRDTFSYGQVNLLLLVLVCGDLRNKRFAGVGVGLAAATKLTPVIFIGYLILARRYRAAATASVTAAAATLLALLAAPEASKAFWTDAVWDTGRIGKLYYVSNQSLRGVVARLDAESTWWLAGHRLRGDRRDRLPDQPDHLGAPPGVDHPGAVPAAGREHGRSAPAGGDGRRFHPDEQQHRVALVGAPAWLGGLPRKQHLCLAEPRGFTHPHD
jgi:alpha-1,2-mannosyltransferase